ncbi:MAG: phosphohistidine phosphatase SixA [Vicinamibacterales bacterium]
MAVTRSLYLIRHGIAAERGDKWPDDTLRPLTHQGAVRMRHVVRGLQTLGTDIDLILTSPLVRAMETAELVSRGLESRPDVVSLPVLAPGGTPARVAEALAARAKVRGVALVGHEPDLGELAGWLIGSRTPLQFKKGGVCRIDCEDWPPARQNQLVWLATPRMLRGV